MMKMSVALKESNHGIESWTDSIKRPEQHFLLHDVPAYKQKAVVPAFETTDILLAAKYCGPTAT